jgi:Spy/CpxP family protein refolding chaperone
MVVLAAAVALAASHAGGQTPPSAPPGAPSAPAMPTVPAIPETPRASPPARSGQSPTGRPGAPSKTPPMSVTERFATALDLSDKQKAEWDGAERETRVIVSPLILRMRTAQRELDAALKQGQTEDVVKERVDALAAVQSEIRRARTDMERRMTAVLTPEQRRKYDIITRR